MAHTSPAAPRLPRVSDSAFLEPINVVRAEISTRPLPRLKDGKAKSWGRPGGTDVVLDESIVEDNEPRVEAMMEGDAQHGALFLFFFASVCAARPNCRQASITGMQYRCRALGE